MTAESQAEVPGTWRYVVSYSTGSTNPDVPSEGEAWEIRELYPDNGDKFGYTAGPIAPYGETIDELREELLHMLAALDQPILDLTTKTPQLRVLEDDPSG